MDLTPFFGQPPHAYYTGLLGSSESISSGVVQLGDHWYVLDLESDRFRFTSIPALRPQQDISERPGEQTLTAEGLWRRVPSTWIGGAGQKWFDRNEGDPTRFRRSRGIDPWEPWELSLLPDTTLVTTTAAGWLSMAVGSVPSVGTRLAVSGGAGKLILVASNGTFTTVAGLTGDVWVTSTGGRIYVSDDTGIHFVSGATAVTSFNVNVDAAQRLFFGKNRLLALKSDDIYDVPTDGTAPPTLSLDYMDGWQWTGATSGQEAFFLSGFAGDKGRVFALTVLEDGTGLGVPTVALELPDGEVPLCVTAYSNLLFVGTTLGVRMCQQSGQTLQMGELVGQDPDVSTGPQVRCLEPQNHFVWYGWDNTFPDAAGLGRLDLRTTVAPLAPAFASDLMSHETGTVNAVATFSNRRWFTTGIGLYRQSDNHVETGFLETGRITFNIADEKTPVFADVRHSPLLSGETVAVEVGSDTSPYSQVGVSNAVGTTRPLYEFPLNGNRAVYNEMRVTLNGTGDETPILTGITLGAQVAPDRSFNVYIPLVLADTVTAFGQDYEMDITEELNYLLGLVASQRIVRFRQGAWVSLVFAEDYEWIPHHGTVDDLRMNGTLVLKLKSAEMAR